MLVITYKFMFSDDFNWCRTRNGNFGGSKKSNMLKFFGSHCFSDNL